MEYDALVAPTGSHERRKPPTIEEASARGLRRRTPCNPCLQGRSTECEQRKAAAYNWPVLHPGYYIMQ
ncbi:hypothetical protein DPV78_011802 [Talaromyces pinophilus]|nr:hypothetical protein DPV78_011802 [Talaromyces pinophilus]